MNRLSRHIWRPLHITAFRRNYHNLAPLYRIQPKIHFPTPTFYIDDLFPPGYRNTGDDDTPHICSICYESFLTHNSHLFHCNHLFCRTCTFQMYIRPESTGCPLCRTGKKSMFT